MYVTVNTERASALRTDSMIASREEYCPIDLPSTQPFWPGRDMVRLDDMLYTDAVWAAGNGNSQHSD